MERQREALRDSVRKSAIELGLRGRLTEIKKIERPDTDTLRRAPVKQFPKTNAYTWPRYA